MIKIGLNGFGRIGRAITRILSDSKAMRLTVVNELDRDIENLGYLIKYDSIYGKFQKSVKTHKSKNLIQIGKNLVLT